MVEIAFITYFLLVFFCIWKEFGLVNVVLAFKKGFVSLL